MGKGMVKGIIGVLFLSLSMSTFGGNDGYFVTYNHHIEKGEWELMWMGDYTFPSKTNRHGPDGQRNYFSEMWELEYSPTEQLALELMVEDFHEFGTGANRYEGQRWEMRYRLFKDEVPLNPMIYFEWEDLYKFARYKMEVSGWVDPPYQGGWESDSKKDEILEQRFNISQDVGNWNFAFNWIDEISLQHSHIDFGYSLGIAHHFGGGMQHCGMKGMGGDCTCKTTMPDCNCAHCKGENVPCPCGMTAGGFMAGVELFGGVGDTKGGLKVNFPRQEHYLAPFLMVHLSQNTMLHLEFAKGLSRSSDNLIRIAIGWEF